MATAEERVMKELDRLRSQDDRTHLTQLLGRTVAERM